MSEKVPNLSIRYRDTFEKRRLEALARGDTITNFLLGLAFKMPALSGSDKEYPGWEVVERTRRDKGIKIAHEKHGEQVLYPEDDAFSTFEE